MIKVNTKKVIFLSILVLLVALVYQFISIDPGNFNYAFKIRTPKLLVIMISAFCIGSASIVFQSVINNTIVTPCLLGINSLYILVHTLMVFILGSNSIFVTNKIVSFIIDLIIMGTMSVLVYGILFKKAKGNILYVLLSGTVIATLFTSITTTLQRVMDPNEYATLQNSLIASFNKVNSKIIFISLIVIACVIIYLWKDLKMLDVLSLGKEQAINLGVNYDKCVKKLLIGVSLFIAIATAMVGPISFLGLIIANLSRQLFKTYKHNYLIWGSALIGIVVLLLGQTIIEHALNFSVNISVFINIGGGIYFLYLLLKSRRSL